MGMQKVSNFVNMVKLIWNVEIETNQAEDILNKYPNILSSYNLQKELFGFNMFDGRGHKPTKSYSKAIELYEDYSIHYNPSL